MSSTNRGIIRNAFDYYVTPQKAIRNFIDNFKDNLESVDTFFDPCAGGDSQNEMPFPTVLKEFFPEKDIITADIRKDSLAEYKIDFLNTLPLINCENTAIIGNPPFDLSRAFIETALYLKPVFIIYLLRLGFLATNKRKDFLSKNRPEYIFVLSSRPSFIPRPIIFNTIEGEEKIIKKGSKDSSEYAFFIWTQNWKENYSKTFII